MLYRIKEFAQYPGSKWTSLLFKQHKNFTSMFQWGLFLFDDGQRTKFVDHYAEKRENDQVMMKKNFLYSR